MKKLIFVLSLVILIISLLPYFEKIDYDQYETNNNITMLECLLHEKSVPIVYRGKLIFKWKKDEYNIRFFGLQKWHPFDTEKFSKIYNSLISTKSINSSQFIKPRIVNESQLLLIHTPKYLNTLNEPKYVSKYAEFPHLQYLPSILLYHFFLKPNLYMVGGTILSGELALKVIIFF